MRPVAPYSARPSTINVRPFSIQILVVDQEDDRRLAARALCRQYRRADVREVDSEETLRQALRTGTWDVVVTGSYPGWGTAQDVRAVVREVAPTTPTVLMTSHSDVTRLVAQLGWEEPVVSKNPSYRVMARALGEILRGRVR